MAQLAAENYMNAGLDPTLQALTAGDPGQFLSQASTMTELDQSSGDDGKHAERPGEPGAARPAGGRPADRGGNALQAQMNTKKKAIDAKIDQVNSAAMKQAMAIFTQTGQYPNITIPTANTVGAQALQAALSQPGRPLRLGRAGPSAFDCSGLVVWAFAQEGIALPHYTGDLWNSGVHVPRATWSRAIWSSSSPISVTSGIYIGNGLMVDAPDFGETVQVEPVYWAYFVGAVRIG